MAEYPKLSTQCYVNSRVSNTENTAECELPNSKNKQSVCIRPDEKSGKTQSYKRRQVIFHPVAWPLFFT